MRSPQSALRISCLDRLESRRLLSTVNVTQFGAKADDGLDDTGAIVRALNSAGAGDTVYFPAGVFDVKNIVKGLTISSGKSIAGVNGESIIRGSSASGELFHISGDNVSVKNLTFQGGGLFLDRSTGYNTNITVDNNIFQLDATGEHPSAITFTSGLAKSVISNNYFTGYTGGFGIYGYNYSGLTIHNNEFVNITAGMHIDAFGSSSNLIVQANYVVGAKGMGFEFQGSATNLQFLDNWYEHPNLSSNFHTNDTSFAFSLILDKSTNITIARNAIIAPERPDGVGSRIAFELGGDNTNVYDNYINGINHVAAMNDGTGSASVTFHDNYMANYLQSPSNSFPASNRTFTQYNNGSNVALTWDINRGHPGINGTFGEEEVDLPDDGGGTDLPVDSKAPTALSVAKQGATTAFLKWTDNDNDELGFSIEASADGKPFREINFTKPDVVKFLVTGLKAGVTYTFRVRSFNAVGYSAYSNSVTYKIGSTSGTTTGTGTGTGTTTGGGTTTTTTTTSGGGTTTTTTSTGGTRTGSGVTVASLVLPK